MEEGREGQEEEGQGQEGGLGEEEHCRHLAGTDGAMEPQPTGS